ncbi:MAG: hypothetical protein OQL19_04025 [Gammaproteobacteria bacterium]|nr:hypothetical protein [Gammaproteobacteria bacterium]
MNNIIQIKVNKYLSPQFTQGKIIKVSTDSAGTPLNAYWRARLKDAEVDNCCEVVKTSSNTKTKKSKK